MRRDKIYIYSVILTAIVLISLSPGAAANQKGNDSVKKLVEAVESLDYLPGELLIKFKRSVVLKERNRVKKLIGAYKTIKTIRAGDKPIELVKLRPGVTVETAVKKIKSFKKIAAAEPNFIRRDSYFPNDPYFPNQWGLNNTGQFIVDTTGTPDADIDAVEAWALEQGGTNPANLAVIDSGIDRNHPDLAGKLWQNLDETVGNDFDDDGNGYVDDANGYNFAGISQLYFNVGWSLGQNTSSQIAAQSIKGTGQKLTHIGLILAKRGNPSAPITVSIRSSLSGSDLASFSISPSETRRFLTEIYKPLSSSVNLTSGDTYYIVVRTTNNNTSSYYVIYDNSDAVISTYLPNPYRDGQEYWWSGTAWTGYPNDDLYFRTNDNAEPRDDNGHGTHVSGIAAAAGDNGQGVSGVSMGAKVMPLKALDSSGSGFSADIISAIYYAAENNGQVINMSLGGYSFSQFEQDAVNYANSRGVVIFAAAGNDGGTIMNYPAGYANVIGVGATTNQDLRAGFSNFNSSVDLSAPGHNVYSTLPTYPVAINSYGYLQDYDYLSGTSMATPMAAGLATLVLSRAPNYTPAQVEQVMEAYADDLGDAGRDDYFGFGRINAFQTLMGIPVDDVVPPSTLVEMAPSAPDGDNNWYKTAPTITLTPDETATTYYQWDSTETLSWQTYSGTFLAPEGDHTFYYYSVDLAGNTETIKDRSFKVDTGLPVDPTVASSSHIVGDWLSDNTVDLDLVGANDEVSGVEGYSVEWSQNATDTPAQIMNLPASGNATDTATSPPLPDGSWYAHVSTKDVAGNWTSTAHQGPFNIDTLAPVASVTVPQLSTDQTKRTTFIVRWSATDAFSGVANYDVQYKDGASGVWTTLASQTALTQTSFAGVEGHTYYFRARARDNAGNTGVWSAAKSTVVPIDNTDPALSYTGSWTAITDTGQSFFKDTVHYSTTLNDSVSFTFTSKAVALIGAKGPDRGRADIYIDGSKVKTVDSYATSVQYRKVIYYKTWATAAPHTITIVNKATAGRPRFDVDGIAVLK